MFCYVVPIQERWLVEIILSIITVAGKLTLSADIFAISLDDFKVNEEEGISHGHISAEIQRNWESHIFSFSPKFSRIFQNYETHKKSNWI